MDVLLKDVVGFIGQYAAEIVLWLIAFALAIVAWHVLWPVEQWAIAGALSVAYLGAVAHFQPHIIALFKTRRKSHKKK